MVYSDHIVVQMDLDSLQSDQQEERTIDMLKEQLLIVCQSTALTYAAICGEKRGQVSSDGCHEQGKDSTAHNEVVDHAESNEKGDASHRELARRGRSDDMEALLRNVSKNAARGLESRKKAIWLHSELDKLTRQKKALERDLNDERRKTEDANRRLEDEMRTNAGLDAIVIERERKIVDGQEKERRWEEEERTLREAVRRAEAAKREADLAGERWKGRAHVLDETCNALKEELLRSAATLQEQREASRWVLRPSLWHTAMCAVRKL